jgi:hypothetical protein
VKLLDAVEDHADLPGSAPVEWRIQADRAGDAPLSVTLVAGDAIPSRAPP